MQITISIVIASLVLYVTPQFFLKGIFKVSEKNEKKINKI
jgi:hypothetical protein